MTQRDIDSALEKLRSERGKALEELKQIVLRNDRDKLLFHLIHQHHLVSVIARRDRAELDWDTKAICGVAEDAYSYAMQLVFKYGRRRSSVDLADYSRLVEICRFINNSFELEHFVHYVPFERSGERLQTLRFDFGSALADATMTKVIEYMARHERDVALRNNGAMPVRQLIGDIFRPAFDPELAKAFGLDARDIMEFYGRLEDGISERMREAVTRMPRLEAGLVDATNIEAFQAARFAYTLNYTAFIDRFGPRRQGFRKFFRRVSLSSEDVDEGELRHFAIWRRPLLRLDSRHFTLSPELLGFSVNIGLHYELLRGPSTKDAYQAKRAQQFQTRSERALEEAGLYILGRNLAARYGPTDLGDIDILAEDSDRYLTVECKGVALPLPVYFHDLAYIRDVHLPYLRDEKRWDSKVVDRQLWLDAQRPSLGLSPSKPITSVIITENAEVISHFSDVVCLTIREFPRWYAASKERHRTIGFEEFQADVLKKVIWKPSSRDEVEGYYGIRFAKN